ncbi:MAG: mobile mystery protein B [Bacteriovoracaceae bacterium]
MSNFLFKDRDGQTPLPPDLLKGLKPKNIQTMGELDQYEEQNIAEGLAWLENTSVKSLDYSFWLDLHKKLLGNVWSWAGDIRTHELANPDFLFPCGVRTELMQLLGDSEYWFTYNTYSKKEIIARIHEKLLTIHPFANGNGRWSRILTEYICKQYEIETPTWNIKSKENPQKRRKEYIEAVETARHKKQFQNLVETIFG